VVFDDNNGLTNITSELSSLGLDFIDILYCSPLVSKPQNYW
jgi:hypothetical protein